MKLAEKKLRIFTGLKYICWNIVLPLSMQTSMYQLSNNVSYRVRDGTVIQEIPYNDKMLTN